jgi:hypothetical protein
VQLSTGNAINNAYRRISALAQNGKPPLGQIVEIKESDLPTTNNTPLDAVRSRRYSPKSQRYNQKLLPIGRELRSITNGPCHLSTSKPGLLLWLPCRSDYTSNSPQWRTFF